MAEPLVRALTGLRAALLDPETLVRAVASGRRRGADPSWRRAEMRYVDLKAGRRLQVTCYDATQAHTHNHDAAAAPEALDALLDEPFGNWHLETATHSTQLRVTKKGEAEVHTRARPALGTADPAASSQPDGEGAGHAQPSPAQEGREHDRVKPRLLAEDHPCLRELGIADDQGRVKPSRRAKYRQVEEFLRNLEAALRAARQSGALRDPTPQQPWLLVDLGCGNAYLTFAAQAFLADVRGLPVRLVGIEQRADLVARNEDLAVRLGVSDTVSFLVGDIDEADPAGRPDVVLALHACDTATDDALARAVGWAAPLVLAAPCCHHDVSAQLRATPAPAPYALLTRSGILRERFADTLTDALRAAVLRLHGYRVDVVDFVDSKHTPRNTLLRAVRTGAAADESVRADYDELTGTWNVRPHLARLLHDRVG